MSQMQSLSRVEHIEGRIDKGVVGSISVSAQQGMAVRSMEQALEIAKLMAVSDKAVPAHLRGNPGACLAVAIQGWEWGINPFAIANKSYVVNDRIGYESALYHAVLLRRAPISGRLRTKYIGEGAARKCHVEATLADGTGNVEYTSPPLGNIKVKNSPLWLGDTDQQLFYYSVRAFARRHFPDVMMGIYTSDELIDAGAIPGSGGGHTTVSDAPARNVRGLIDRITSKPVSEGQTFEPTPEAVQAAAELDPTPTMSDADAEATLAGSQNDNTLPGDNDPADSAPPPMDARSDAERVSSIDGFYDAIADAAQDAKLGEAEVNKWLAGKVKLTTKNNKVEQATVAQRVEWLSKVRGGRLD